jgi:hypothetical protein
VHPGGDKEKLFFAYHWKNAWAGCNLYEKLRFVELALASASPREILERASPGFALSADMLAALPSLLVPPLRRLLIAGRLALRPALRLAAAKMPDRRALAGLLAAASWNENQQQKIISLVEEIAFREKQPWRGVLARIRLPALLKREMPQRAIEEALARKRYPGLTRQFEEWRRITRLFSSAGMRITPRPFFEKGEVDLTLPCRGAAEAEEILARLQSKGQNGEKR